MYYIVFQCIKSKVIETNIALRTCSACFLCMNCVYHLGCKDEAYGRQHSRCCKRFRTKFCFMSHAKNDATVNSSFVVSLQKMNDDDDHDGVEQQEVVKF